ncbi:hypothetical protein DICPUDRAFT_31325 [Dictyostelium purpureum]|uniref:Mitochondrial import inner membrane translocase subunit n=1 Tax=Dictyostelium purpureum TaxID=5786 RepID=F0ZH01_DICPU|nr:uncharacterized protein DICPUDRAFT_31325 [Dictyostelium purpureum]EGC36766.1 hypothetical protein DICPUDRAFT_31325 [Dictyostelium purpureum]|eukprot:XP_003286712.1 hypothetical protein DICPUDRAFT_31325 [Dictyostelium purpureum]
MDDIDVKILEMKMISKMFTGISEACSAKCISKYSEGELNVGEAVCAERCAQKWMDTFKNVQSKINPQNAVPATPAEPAEQKKSSWF